MRPMVLWEAGRSFGGVWSARAERDELRRQNEQLQKQVVDKDKTIAHREKQIADLERQLAAYRKDSTNSSKPPRRIGPKRPRSSAIRAAKRANANPVVKRDTQANTVPRCRQSGSTKPWLWTRKPASTVGAICRSPAIRATKPRATCSAIK